MRRYLPAAAVAGLILLAAPAHLTTGAVASSQASAIHLFPARGQAQAVPQAGSNNLIYNGGPVQTGTPTPLKTYLIFWGQKSNFDPNYGTLVTGFFKNVAHDSNLTSNVYSNDPQYYQIANGTQTNISYNEQYGAGVLDQTLPTTSGCKNHSGGGTVCLSDAQIQSEVTKEINANHWPTGLGSQFFVFLSNNISTCSSGSYQCAFTVFCAYHGTYTLNGNPVMYANMPYTGHNLSACGGGNYPNNDPPADSVINVTSHEANETITDPELNAWYDASGSEIGDKCAWNFGTPLGGSSGSYYNQVINGTTYELQQEWSNAIGGCALTG